MTTAAELISAAEAADWSSFKSLVNAATPGDIAAIGSTWNDVMNAVAAGVAGSATAAPKHLFSTAMESFFTAAGDYLTGDSVADALLNIAQSSQFSGIDRLSAEMIAIIDAAPAAIAATASPETAGFILGAIGSNQGANPEVTPAELKNTFGAFTEKFGALLDVNIVLDTASNIAVQDSFNGTNNFASFKLLLDLMPTHADAADPFSLFAITDSIARYQSNPDVTPSQMNSAFKLLVEHYGAQLDVNIVLSVAAQIAQSDSFDGTDNLSSVETLLAAPTTDKASAYAYLYQGVLSSIANNQGNPAITPEELNHAFKALVANYGNLLDVDTVLMTAAQLASNGSFGGTDYLSSVETLLGAAPGNKAAASQFTLLDIVSSIANNQLNSAVTADELAHTFKILAANYGALLDVNVVLDTIVQLSFNDSAYGMDNFASVNALLAAHPDNAAFADAFNLSNALSAINGNAYNAGITEHELAQTIGKFMTTYGEQVNAIDLGFSISDDVAAGKFEAAGAIANHMDATQFTDAASIVDTYSNAMLLTTGNDSFDGSAAAKIAVYGGTGRDVIDFSANTGSDGRYLDGGAGRDTLIGGLGDDVLDGGRGSDTLTGGDGVDTFRFDHLGTRIDHVTDFNAAQGDRIDLHDVLGSDAGLAISDYVHLDILGGNTILSVDRDGTGGASGFVQVAQLDNVTGLDVNDLYANGQIIIG